MTSDRINIKNTLSKTFGLRDQEIDCYLYLLQHSGVPSSIVAKRLDMKRSTVKYTLNQLVKQKFATVLEKNGTHLFFPVSPENIENIFQQKKKEIEDNQKEFSHIKNELTALSLNSQSLPQVQFFEGVEGVKKMFRNVLQGKNTVYGYVGVDDDDIDEEIYEFLNTEYSQRRIELGNSAYIIKNRDTAPEYFQNDTLLKRTTLIASSEIAFSSYFHIYGDKIAFYSYRKKNVFGTVIESKELRDNQLSLFVLAWNFLRLQKENKRYKDVALPL